jgi:kynurenine formamidase
MRVRFLVSMLGVAALVSAGGLLAQKKTPPSAQDWLRGVSSGQTRVIDLTYPINDRFPAWPGDEHPFVATVNATPQKDGYFTRKFTMLEHYATHLDAPIHFPPGKLSVDQIPVNRLFGPAVVIDVRGDVVKDSDYRLSPARVREWEKAHGHIPAGAIVILRTGWSTRVPDASRYRNMDSNGTMHFPGFSVEAAKLLLTRRISALGIDTMSVDYGPSKNFEVHRLTLPAGLYHLENLADLSSLPEAGAFLIAAPIKLEGGSGGACRVFAVLP